MNRKFLSALLLLCIALLGSGCVDEQITADRIAEEMQTKQENITDYSTTIYTEFSYAGQIQIMEYDYSYKNPGKTKTVIRSPERNMGDTTVCNGEKTWVYDPDRNLVQVFEIPEMQTTGKIDYSTIISQYINSSEISVDRVDTLEGRDTYVVSIHTKENETQSDIPRQDITVWFDEETWIPLKIESVGTANEEDAEVFYYKVEYRSFKVNTGLGDEYFEFEIPEDAEVQIIDDIYDITGSRTLEQVQQTCNFSIMIPSYIPDGYELETVFTNDELAETTSVQEYATLIYSNGEDTFHITEIYYVDDNVAMPDSEEGASIYINEIEGTLLTFDENRLLEWNTGNLRISIDSTLEKKEIIKIAESMQ